MNVLERVNSYLYAAVGYFIVDNVLYYKPYVKDKENRGYYEKIRDFYEPLALPTNVLGDREITVNGETSILLAYVKSEELL